MFNYPLLETLWAVREHGTYDKASRSLGITRSAISQKLRLLEERWGAPAITRNPVSTTDLGELLCSHLENVRLLETKLLLKFGDQFDASVIDPVSIELAYQDALLPTGFLDELICISDRQCEFFFDTTLQSGRTLNDRLRRGDAKVAISCERIESPHYRVSTLGNQDFLAVASSDFVALQCASRIDKRFLQTARSVTHNATTGLCAKFIAQIYGSPGETNTDSLPTLHSILNTCLAGEAWAMLPVPLVTEWLENGKLVNLYPTRSLKVEVNLYVLDMLDAALPHVGQLISLAANRFLSSLSLLEICESVYD